MENISVTGGEDVYGNPSESRWFTGADPIWVEHEAIRRLAAEGITPANAAIWAQSYYNERDTLRKEYGIAALATYLKNTVVEMSCEAFKSLRIMGRAAEQRGIHPGEKEH